MRRRVAWILLLVALLIFLGGPVFEHFDHWDHFPQSGNDILLTLVAVVICLAAAVSLIRKIEGSTAPSSDLAPEPALACHTFTTRREASSYSDSPGVQLNPLRI